MSTLKIPIDAWNKAALEHFKKEHLTIQLDVKPRYTYYQGSEENEVYDNIANVVIDLPS
jgi:hypothetical protein